MINRAVAAAFLKKRGHSLVHAVNGRETLAAVAREPFDLIFMDVQMPEMGGLVATRGIREFEQGTGRYAPIVAMTAHVMTGDRERCLAAGMDDYLSKPLQKPDLLALLARVATANGVPHFAPAARHQEIDLKAAKNGSAPEADVELEAFPTFSRARLLDEFDGDEVLVRRMIALFHENTPGLLENIRSSILRRSAADLGRSAHALLSTLGACGAQNAHRLTRRLETQAHQEDFREIGETFAEFDRGTADIHATLTAFTANGE